MSNTENQKTNRAATDMTEAMDETMQRLQGRFQDISGQLQTKLDEMGTRIYGLEKNVAELMTQAGMEEEAVSK